MCNHRLMEGKTQAQAIGCQSDRPLMCGCARNRDKVRSGFGGIAMSLRLVWSCWRTRTLPVYRVVWCGPLRVFRADPNRALPGRGHLANEGPENFPQAATSWSNERKLRQGHPL